MSLNRRGDRAAFSMDADPGERRLRATRCAREYTATIAVVSSMTR